ncbi:hypothetical protein AHAS_Ahas15G0215800 [Arachis hypogaea]
MDEYLEHMRRNLGLLSIEDEDQSVSEEVEEKVPVSSEISMKNKVVEIYEPWIPYPQRLIEVIEEHENLLPKDSMEHHVKEREEANQGSSHSIEAESYIEEEFSELPI